MTMADIANRVFLLRVDVPNLTKLDICAALDDLEADARREVEAQDARATEAREAIAGMALELSMLDGGD